MRPRQIIILSIIFGMLVFGILLKSWIRSADDHAAATRNGLVALAAFDPVKLERIRITRGGRPPAVELAKENGVWKVKSLWDAKGDPAKIENFIKNLRAAQGELRGSGKNLFEDFGIQDADAFSIELFGTGNALLQDFRLGTKQAGDRAFFIRKVAGEDIYLVEMNMAELLGMFAGLGESAPPSLFWADMSLFDLDSEKVTKITVQKVKGNVKTMTAGVELIKDPKDPAKSSWVFLQRADRSYLLDPEKVVRFIATLNSIKAQKVVDPAGKDYGLENPGWEIAVTEGDRETLLSIGGQDEKEKGCFVKISGNPAIFILGATYTGDLEIDDTRFAKEIPKEPASDAEAAKLAPQSPGKQTP